MTQSSEAARGGRAWIAAVALLTGVGAVLRFRGLDYLPFWLDETCTWLCMTTLFERGDDAPFFIQGSNLLYYLLVRGWSTLAGESEWALRSFSALMGTLCIPVLALLARRLGGRAAAVACASLVALHPLHVYYSHEARAYTTWTLALSLALLALHTACTRNRTRDWLLFAGACVLSLGGHILSLFWIPFALAGSLWAAQPRAVLRRAAIVAGLVLVFGSGYAALTLLASMRAGAGAWIANSFDPLTSLPLSLWSLLPSGEYPSYLHGLSLGSALSVRWFSDAAALTAMTLPIFVTGLALAQLAGRRAQVARRSWLPLAALSLGPIAAMWILSVVRDPLFLPGRYDLIAWPALCVWFALGLSALARSAPARLQGAVLAVVLASLAACAWVPIERFAHFKARVHTHIARAQVLERSTDPGDLVVAFSYDADEVSYYLHRRGFEATLESWPPWLDRQIGWVDSRRDVSLARSGALAEPAAQLAARMHAVLDDGGRVFLLQDTLHAVRRDPRVEVNGALLRAIAKAAMLVVVHEPLNGVDRVLRFQDYGPGKKLP